MKADVAFDSAGLSLAGNLYRPDNQVTGQLPAIVADASSVGEADVNQFIDRQPDDVATMLRGWLADSRTVGSA